MQKSTKVVPAKTEAEGNTNSSAKRANASKKWCFTWNNFDGQKSIELLKSTFGAKNISFLFGEEIGESGTPHLQGFIIADKKLRWTELQLPVTIHWEVMKGSIDNSVKYCSKDGKIHTNKFEWKPIPCLKETELRPWQKQIVDIVKGPVDDRKIYWFWEPEGNIGKSALVRYLMIKHNAVQVEGKKDNILYCAATYPSELYIFDFERSMENYISYSAMEKIKNAAYMVSKYESKSIVRPFSHIICFANFPPEADKLSKDRWVIREIKKKKKL